MELQICLICKEELAGGPYEEYGICPVCGDIVDDIIAKYLEMVARKCSEESFDEMTFDTILKYLDEIVDWVEYFEDLEEFSSDEKYYQRFRIVLEWLEKNREHFERIILDNFKKCEGCGADFSKECLQIEKHGEWVMVFCGSCGKLISKHYSPKKEL
jgi:DNA-directed RNA polymerase subunit N (RpoN/RPB10)